jgi:hypothetical protein
MQYRWVHFLVFLGISSLAYLLVTEKDQVVLLLDAWQPLRDLHARPEYQAIVDNGLAVALVSLVALLFQSANLIAGFVVEKLPFSRSLRKLMSGRHFVEGDWPLIVVYGQESPEPGKLLYIGFLTIEYRQEQLYVCGDDWTPDGKHAVSFESIRSSFHTDNKERRLQYFYRQGETWQDARMRGYTEIYFYPVHARSDVHAGQFRDREHNDVRFYARRKTYKIGEKRVRSPDAKKEAAKALWNDLAPNIQNIIAERINSDCVSAEMARRAPMPAG